MNLPYLVFVAVLALVALGIIAAIFILSFLIRGFLIFYGFHKFARKF